MEGWRGGWIAGSHTLPNSHDLPGAWLLLLLLLVLLGGVRCSAGGVIITLALALALALALTLTNPNPNINPNPNPNPSQGWSHRGRAAQRSMGAAGPR